MNVLLEVKSFVWSLTVAAEEVEDEDVADEEK